MTHDNEPPVCKVCGDEYYLRDGYEVTDYCDPCAQELAPELLQLVKDGLGIIQMECPECEGCKVDLCFQCHAKAIINRVRG
jgi:hypothetical protein